MSLLSEQPGSGLFRYEHHRPETTLLYQLVSRYYPQFRALMAQQETPLPGYVQQDIENSYLSLEHLEPNPLQQLHGGGCQVIQAQSG